MAYDVGTGLAGAGTGAAIGSAAGPIGTGVGALVGGGLGFFGPEEDKLKKLDTMSPEQKSFLDELLQSLGVEGGLGALYQKGLSGLSDILDPSGSSFQKFADPYMRQFNEQTIPGIAERFAGSGALSSSGFGQALSSAAGGLQENLASLKTQLQQKAISDIMRQYSNMTNTALSQRPFGYQQQQGSMGLGGGLVSEMGKGAGMALGKSLGLGG